MTLPPPTWGPPPAGWAAPPRRRVLPRRRRLGWTLIGIGAVVLLAAGATAGRRSIELVTALESTRIPGSVSVACREGDEWRIGPATGRSQTSGPVTVSRSWTVDLDLVTVELDGEAVRLRGAGSGVTETFELMGSTYTAVATFTCPADGTATVSFAGPDGEVAGVFPSFGRVIRTFGTFLAFGLVSVAALTVGIVFAARHRRSLERGATPHVGVG